VRLGINSEPQASLVWQIDIEFRQCTSGVARFDWLVSPRLFRDRTRLLLHFDPHPTLLVLVCNSRTLDGSELVAPKLSKRSVWEKAD
jgi:hypothetical protein